jgi:hypothetical protein
MSKEFKFSNISDEFKASFKALLSQFNVAPVVTPTPSPVAPVTVAKFGEAELEDGTIIKWEGEAPLAVGTPLMVIDPSNPEGFLPAPDGEHKGKDGSVIVVASGIVTEYTPAEVVAPIEAPVEPGMTAQIATLREELEALKSKFSVEVKPTETEIKLASEIETLKSELANSNKTVKEMFELFGAAMDTPSANPVETPSKPLSKKDKMLQNIFS